MNRPAHLLGVLRERAHSPGRESDDERILRRVAECLVDRGHAVRLTEPEQLSDALDDRPWDLVFYMCEREAALETLAAVEGRGTRLVNHPEGVRNTFRHRMVPLLAALGDAWPTSRLVTTTSVVADDGDVWVKRGDFHQTQAGDVVRAADAAAATRALGDLCRRGVASAVLQSHVDGDLVKFYGVGTQEDSWFHRFYHRDQCLRGTAYDLEELRRLVRGAADLSRLDVYGGDAIVTPEGRLVLIDLNAWPSFALVREDAALHIADLIERRLREPAAGHRGGAP